MTPSSPTHGRVSHGRLGEERQGEAQVAVHAELQQHAGEDDRAGRRRLGVGVRQPGVEREDRHLDRERERRRRQKSSACGATPEAQASEVREEERPLARHRAMPGGEVQDRQEHEDAARHREEEELHRGVDAPRAAPDADDEVHRHEHDFPEDVEEREVEGARGSRASRSRAPGRRSRSRARGSSTCVSEKSSDDRGQERRQQDEHERDAVDPDRVADAERGNPVDALERTGSPGAPASKRDPERERDGELERPRRPARTTWMALGATPERAAGARRPAVGRKTRTSESMVAERGRPSSPGRPEHEEHQRHDAEEERERVVAHVAGLEEPQEVAASSTRRPRRSGSRR